MISPTGRTLTDAQRQRDMMLSMLPAAPSLKLWRSLAARSSSPLTVATNFAALEQRVLGYLALEATWEESWLFGKPRYASGFPRTGVSVAVAELARLRAVPEHSFPEVRAHSNATHLVPKR